jgi:HK97 gp10 family phage protein
MASKFVDNTSKVKAHCHGLHMRAVKNIAQHSLEEAQRNAPYKTGALRDSGMIEQIGDLKWEGSFNTEYAVAVEFGTRHMTARHYVIRAVEETRWRASRDEFSQIGRARF